MPYSEEFDDFFYSRADGRAECRHVFLAGNGLPDRFAGRSRFVISELGFGTGLNFVETWSAWEAVAPLDAELAFHSFEASPMARIDILRALSAWPELAGQTMALAAAWPEQPRGDVKLTFADGKRTVRLAVHVGAALDRLCAVDMEQADAWYLDGFAPSRNPDMWSLDLMQAVARRTAPAGSFATYSAAGWVRRNLEAAGFMVQKRPGHTGKRDMSTGALIG